MKFVVQRTRTYIAKKKENETIERQNLSRLLAPSKTISNEDQRRDTKDKRADKKKVSKIARSAATLEIDISSFFISITLPSFPLRNNEYFVTSQSSRSGVTSKNHSFPNVDRSLRQTETGKNARFTTESRISRIKDLGKLRGAYFRRARAKTPSIVARRTRKTYR